MQNTYDNQNPNNMNQGNPTIQGQYQPNQLYMQPQGMNPPPYNFSTQNLNTPYNNTTSNQALFPGQPNPYQNSPYMQFYRPAQGFPLTNLSGQPGVINIQPQSYNNNFENIKNINQLPHLNFTQPDDNTFLISSKGIIVVPIIIIFTSLPFLIAPLVVGDPMMFIMYIFASIPIIVSICLCIHMNLSVSFILGPNNITVKRKSLCRQKTNIYNSGELLRVEYQQNFVHTSKGIRLAYEIVFITKNGGAEKMYSTYSGTFFTFQEIGYFLHVVNKHIQTKMCPK